MLAAIRRWIDDGPGWRWATLSAVFVLTLGCGSDELTESDFEELNGHMVADDGVYLFPNRAWRREGEIGGSFRKTGQLLVLVKKDSPDGIRVRYLPEGETRRFHFQASWDDVPLWEAPRAAESVPLDAFVDASGLSPGVHRLRLERFKEHDEPDDRGKARNFFSQVMVERVDNGVASAVPIIANGYPARFLDFGVTGQSSTQLGGCLFLGPHVFELEVSSQDHREGYGA